MVHRPNLSVNFILGMAGEATDRTNNRVVTENNIYRGLRYSGMGNLRASVL